MSASPNAVEARWISRVVNLGCIACEILCLGNVASECHHIREGRIARSHWLVLPLCPPHHRQSYEYSMHLAKPALMRALGVASEFDLLAIVLEQLGGPRR